MLEPFRYLWKTVTQEINDQFMILKEIADYYKDELKESMKTSKKMKEIKSFMQKADNYSSWKSLAQQYDQLPNIKAQINEVYSPYYDYEYLQVLVSHMNDAREEGDAFKLIEIIRSHSNRNIANANSPFLYRHAYTRSKRLIEQYQEELAKGLEAIMKSDIPQGKKL
jgi:NTE family protein